MEKKLPCDVMGFNENDCAKCPDPCPDERKKRHKKQTVTILPCPACMACNIPAEECPEIQLAQKVAHLRKRFENELVKERT